jgi:N-methylhydantoinase A
VESGPAGGAILAARVARECGLDRVLSFDMGGTTAKICLIDDGAPQQSRSFEVARQYRFMKGSGLPLRIPVIEMVEIGAGGGSVARVDALSRIHVGPESAGAVPGPACYGQGGDAPTVTDANVTLGRIDPDNFAGGTMKLDAALSAGAIDSDVGEALSLSTLSAAFGISEVVEENMANAARVHAVERGKEIRGRTLVAFGGGAALHAARLARKLNIDEVIVPVAAGVGSAVGFLQAPVAYEVVRSRYALLDETFDATGLNALYAEMRTEAEQIVAEAAPDADLIETRTADMRYHGQGHEIAVELPAGPYDVSLRDALTGLFETAYAATYSRRIPGLEVEVMNWTLRLSATVEDPAPCPPMPNATTPEPLGMRDLFDPDTGILSTAPVYRRDALTPGAEIAGPAIIAEDETTTIVLAGFIARLNAVGYIVMQWEGS